MLWLMNNIIRVFLLCMALFSVQAVMSQEKATGQPAFRLMTLNVWNEGRYIPDALDKIVNIVLESKADVVAFSEVRNYKGEDWPTKVVEAIKKKDAGQVFHTMHSGGDVGIISRYPIESGEAVFDEALTSDSGSIVAWRLTLPQGRKVTICAAHLDYKQYGLNLIRGYYGGNPDFSMIDADKDGEPDRVKDVKEILKYDLKSKRPDAIKAFLKFAKKEQAAGRTVILAGDFNEGSHLDWTEKAKDSFGHYGVAIKWNSSMELYKAGFLDAYRVYYPDEVKNPGFTWPAIAEGKKTTTWTPKSDERDRIDFIYYPARPAVFQVNKVWMVGPKAQFINEEKVTYPGDDLFIGQDMPWPTDHNGVMVEFAVKP